MPFRKAHELVGKLVVHCEARNVSLRELSLADFQSFSALIQEDVFSALSIENVFQARSVVGGTARTRVVEAIEEAEKRLSTVD